MWTWSGGHDGPTVRLACCLGNVAMVGVVQCEHGRVGMVALQLGLCDVCAMLLWLGRFSVNMIGWVRWPYS